MKRKEVNQRRMNYRRRRQDRADGRGKQVLRWMPTWERKAAPYSLLDGPSLSMPPLFGGLISLRKVVSSERICGSPEKLHEGERTMQKKPVHKQKENCLNFHKYPSMLFCLLFLRGLPHCTVTAVPNFVVLYFPICEIQKYPEKGTWKSYVDI